MQSTSTETGAASRQELAAALEEFKQGAARLDQVWGTGWQFGNEHVFQGDEIDNYPPFLPSFDEANAAIQSMQVQQFTPDRAVKLLADLGATLEHTGGGCMVGAVYFETHSCGEGPYVWITDAMEYDGVSEGWLVGYYPHPESDGEDHVRVSTVVALREAVEKFKARAERVRVEMTRTQVQAVLAVIAPVVGDNTGPLEEAERTLDSALLAAENGGAR